MAIGTVRITRNWGIGAALAAMLAAAAGCCAFPVRQDAASLAQVRQLKAASAKVYASFVGDDVDSAAVASFQGELNAWIAREEGRGKCNQNSVKIARNVADEFRASVENRKTEKWSAGYEALKTRNLGELIEQAERAENSKKP